MWKGAANHEVELPIIDVDMINNLDLFQEIDIATSEWQVPIPPVFSSN